MLRPFLRRAERLALGAAFCVAAAACSDSSSTGPTVSTTHSITLDASAAYAYLALDTLAQQVSVTTPTTSTAWDMGFFATGVSLNGGAAGPGGVTGYCLCGNANATTAALQAMTAANQLPAFDSVTPAMIPAATAFRGDELDPVINTWYNGSGASATANTGRTFIVRRTTGAGTILAKVQVTNLQGPSATTPGNVSFQFAIEPSVGAAFGATQTATVSVAAAGAPVYFDLAAGAVGNAASWDIAFDGWNILSNGGVSGSGGVSAVPDDVTAFANIDFAYASSAPPQAYRSDTFSGVFALNPWYRYNITGSDNQIWPTYNVYLIRRGTAVYKVQLTGYYSTTGAPRNITIRYAKLAG